MAFVVGFVIVGLVLAIAAVFVFREAARMSEDPPDAVFDPDDAYEWVVRHLPDVAAATLTPDDVRRILDFQLEFFRRKGVSTNGSSLHPQAPVVFGSAETMDYILERCAATGEAYLPEQVEAVVDCQLTYLQAIGAIGRPAEPQEASVARTDRVQRALRFAGVTMAKPERIHEYRNHHLDSTRWDHFHAVRDGDVVVTTAYKAGTTWTQRILAALVLGVEPGGGSLMEVSPWIDARFHGPIEPLIESLDAQTHRRFVKSHLAADGVRFFPEAKYVVVGRDTRDVFMSLWNHYSGYTDLAFSLFNDPERPGPEFPRCPEQPRLWPRWIAEGWFPWEPDGWPFWSHHHHLSTWWQWRDLPNVHFMHFNDMLADIEAEMRRLAAYCEIDVPEEQWPGIVDAVQLDSIRATAKAGTNGEDPAALIFEGGADRFLFKGTNGRWRGVLTDDDLDLYEQAAATLDPGLRAWLEGGRAPQ